MTRSTMWMSSRPVPEMSVLEEQLDEVKALFFQKFGADVDDEDDDKEYHVDEDGTPWVKTVGKAQALSRSRPVPEMSALEEQLDEVKALFFQKFGADVDDEDDDKEYHVDEDGTPWVKTAGKAQ